MESYLGLLFCKRKGQPKEREKKNIKNFTGNNKVDLLAKSFWLNEPPIQTKDKKYLFWFLKKLFF
jgi:hypothetical protein